VTQGLTFLIPLVGVVAACAALGVPRASHYRGKAPPRPPKPRPRPARALRDEERATVLAVLDSERFADKAPAQVYAQLLDENEYLCSIRTMYRILDDADQVKERRHQRRHPTYVKPQLVAHAPNQVWSWDITKVAGPVKGVYYCLYVVLDIFSRYVVAWTVTPSESAAVGQKLIDDACQRHDVQPGQLTVHADRGSPMTAKSTAQLFIDLGITQSHSRPSVSDDNPFSEAGFKTFLYRPGMPDRFGSPEDCRTYFAGLFDWYNEQHYHSGIALLTPADVHRGTAPEIIARRQAVLDAAHQAHPERFVRGAPTHPTPPVAVWINPPATATAIVASNTTAVTCSGPGGPQRAAATLPGTHHAASREDRTARPGASGSGADWLPRGTTPTVRQRSSALATEGALH
jgi:putative transposase